MVGVIVAACAFSDLFFGKIWFYDACPTSLQALHAVNGSDLRISIFHVIPASEASVTVALCALTVAALMLSIGLKTRLSAFTVWLLHLSFYNQNTFIWNCGDSFLQICTLLMFLGPAENMYSLDAWIRRKQGKSALPTMCEPWAQRLLQFQIAVIYCCGFLYKSGQTWMDGTAVHYALNSYSFSYAHIPMFDVLWVSQLVTWGTLAFEFTLFTLIWVKEFRKWVLVAGFFMHSAMFATMSIHALEILIVASYLNFVDPLVIEGLVSKFQRRKLSPHQAGEFSSEICADNLSVKAEAAGELNEPALSSSGA